MPIKPTPINLPHFQKKILILLHIQNDENPNLKNRTFEIWNKNPITSHHLSNVDFNVANLFYFVPKHIYFKKLLKVYFHCNFFLNLDF